MSKTEKTGQKTLTDSEISTARPARRAVLGLMAAGGVVAMTPTTAHASDADNGSWTDRGSCPRGGGGAYTGYTDSDNGAITGRGGYGRGAPYC